MVSGIDASLASSVFLVVVELLGSLFELLEDSLEFFFGLTHFTRDLSDSILDSVCILEQSFDLRH